MSQSRLKDLSNVNRFELNRKSVDHIANKKPSAKLVKQGDGVFVKEEGTYYKKIGPDLVPISAGGSSKTNIVIPESTGTKDTNTCIIRVSTLTTIDVTGWITLSQQYGDYIEPLVIPRVFSSIQNIAVYVVLMGTTIQRFAETMKHISISATPTDTEVYVISCYDIAIQITADKKLQLRIRNVKLNKNGIDKVVISNYIYEGTTVVSDQIYADYTAGNLGIMSEIMLNVKI
jgi:hypothetical protein